MNFANVTSLVIPEGSVTQIADSLGTVLWKAVTGPDYTEPFYVENITNSDETLSIVGMRGTSPHVTVEYSTDKTNWSTLGTTSSSPALTYTLHPGDKLYLRALMNNWGNPITQNGPQNSSINVIRGISRVGGNIMSLLYGSNFTGQETRFPQNSSSNFAGLFFAENYGSTIRDASKLLLPVDTLTSYCYDGMFYGCYTLITAPELPATTLTQYCYRQMFRNCTGLLVAPDFHASVMESYSCQYMFYNCTSLTALPDFSSVGRDYWYTGCCEHMFHGCTGLTSVSIGNEWGSVGTGAYKSMFEGCTGLTTASLLSYYVDDSSCQDMFKGCSNLSDITCLVTYDNGPGNGFTGWVDGVAASGTFVASYDGAQNDFWEYGVDGVPQGWSAEDEYGTPFTPRSSGVQYDDQYINVTNVGVTANTYDSNVQEYVWPFQDVTGTDYESYKPSGTPIFLGDTTSTTDYSRTFKAIVTGKDEYIDSIVLSVSSRDDSGNSWDYTIDVYDENGNQLATLSDYQQQTLTVSFQDYLGSSEHLYIYVKSYSTGDGYRPMFGITSVS